MSLRREKFGLPLLQRELTELSARPRTFLTRAVYAVIFFGLIGWQFGEQFSRSNAEALLDLGRGRQLFDQLVLWQLGGVCLFMPILTSGAIASEKERGTLSLLMITHLSPMLILIEKLGSRVFVMMTLLLLAVPVAAYAYSMGGIEYAQIAASFLLLISTTCYIGAFTLICSSFCSNATSALVASLVLGVPVLGLAAGFVLPAIRSGGQPGQWLTTAFVQLLFVFAFLSLARTALLNRGNQPPKNLGLELLRWTDRFWNNLNREYTGGIIIIRDRSTLPAHKPIVWRESKKKSLGSFRYLLRVLLLVEIPTLFILVLAIPGNISARRFAIPAGLLSILWGIACLVVSVRVASILAGERSRQTLDVLLATPMTGKEIIRQHFGGTLKLMLVMSVPILTCYSFRWTAQGWSFPDLIYHLSSLATVAIYLPLCAWVAMLIGLRIQSQLKAVITTTILIASWIWVGTIRWETQREWELVRLAALILFLAVTIGLPVGRLCLSHRRLIRLTGLATAISIPVGYLCLVWIFESWQWLLNWEWPTFLRTLPGFGVFVSPAVLVLQQESAFGYAGNSFGLLSDRAALVLVNFAWYGFLLMLARAICLRKADTWLGRGG